MKEIEKRQTILIAGNGRLSFSVAVCLVQAENQVILYTKDPEEALINIDKHIKDSKEKGHAHIDVNKIKVTSTLDDQVYMMGIVITDEDLVEKGRLITELQQKLGKEAIIAVNTEGIPLADLQKDTIAPERIIGLNWTEPAHTTYFMEIIANDVNRKELVSFLFQKAMIDWKKDPYIVHNNISIRSRLFSAMVREAFYLVENGYATVQDIDRACRNDAGYYLPFAGNFRYMDLMGTYSYAEVMKKLNADLSKDNHLPDFFTDIISEGGQGMKNNKGFYTYENGDAEHWNKLFAKFSYKIQEIITKYPFNYHK